MTQHWDGAEALEPGTYRVMVSAEDGVGHLTTQQVDLVMEAVDIAHLDRPARLRLRHGSRRW